MFTSICHRATGIVLALGLPVLAIWIASVAAGGDFARTVNGILTSWFGYLALVGWTFAICYHLLNGLRHLGFDVGLGWATKRVHHTAWGVIIAAVVLTFLIWLMVFLR